MGLIYINLTYVMPRSYNLLNRGSHMIRPYLYNLAALVSSIAIQLQLIFMLICLYFCNSLTFLLSTLAHSCTNLYVLTILVILSSLSLLTKTSKSRTSYVCLVKPVSQIDNLCLQRLFINYYYPNL